MTSLIGNRWSKSLMYFLSFATVGFGFFIPAFAAAIASTFVIVVSAILAKGRNWSTVLGMVDAKRNSVWFVAAFLFAVALASLVVFGGSRTSSHLHIRIEPSLILILVTVFFQSFAEEVLFRVFLMKHLLIRFVSSRFMLCVFSALFFSLAHFFNYRLSEGVSLSFWPLFSLFLLGYSGSALYLHQGHVLGAWGFHAGWNAVRYAVVLLQNDNRASESMTFELWEGSAVGLGIAAGLSILSIIHQLRQKQT